MVGQQVVAPAKQRCNLDLDVGGRVLQLVDARYRHRDASLDLVGIAVTVVIGKPGVLTLDAVLVHVDVGSHLHGGGLVARDVGKGVVDGNARRAVVVVGEAVAVDGHRVVGVGGNGWALVGLGLLLGSRLLLILRLFLGRSRLLLDGGLLLL